MEARIDFRANDGNLRTGGKSQNTSTSIENRQRVSFHIICMRDRRGPARVHFQQFSGNN